MKVKHIYTGLLIALMLSSCARASTDIPPTETATSTPKPLPAATTPTPPDIPKRLTVTATRTIRPTSTPTSTPNAPLSAEGPWLLYLHNTPNLYACCGGMVTLPEFILINQDGSGRTSVILPESRQDALSTFLMDNNKSVNYLVLYDQRPYYLLGLYLFRPSQAVGMHVCQFCRNFYNLVEEGGLFTGFYQESEDVSPELILFELPGGEIVERFPLVQCPADSNFCDEHRSYWPEMMRQGVRRSPDGRYLAFVAILDAISSDIFVYDTQEGDLRRLTNDPNWVGGIEWSPDGSQIIMGVLTDEEIFSYGEYFHAPYSEPPVSVWSVSFNTNETKYLYATGSGHYAQDVYFWLDNQRFITYEGVVSDALNSATNLRFVDMRAGTNRILFDRSFVEISYDPIHETFALWQHESRTHPQGVYLVSLRNGNIQYLDEFHRVIRYWDKNSGLFVSDDACEDDPQGLQAVDYRGNSRCIPNPRPTPTPAPLEPATYPAPKGNLSVTVNDGLWLETGDEPPVLVSEETAAEVIWCPDSGCFFYTAKQEEDWRWTLYHVSLPDLTIEMVDEGIESTGTYQWLGGE